MVFITQGVAGGDVLNADDRRDVARVTRVDVFALVRLDLDQTRDALALVRAWIVNRVAFRKRAGINAEENEFADERIAPKFKSEGAKISIIVRRCFHRLVRVGLHSLGRRNVEWTRQVIDDGIEQILDAYVLQRRTADNRHKFIRDRLPTNSGF